MKLKSLLCTLHILLIAGCTTVIDRSIQLPDEFVANAERFSLKSPSRRHAGTVFSHQMGAYDTTALKVGKLTTVNKKHTNTSYDGTNTLLDWFTSGKISTREINEYDVTQNQSYSFDFRKEELIIASSECQSFRLGLQQTAENLTSTKSRQIDNRSYLKRRKTLLVCTIDIHNKQWQLILNFEKNQPVSVELKADTVAYRFEEISEVYALLENRKGEVRQHDLPQRFTPFAGAGVFNGQDRQVAAVSLNSGVSDIWVEKQESVAIQELMLTAGYALILNSWLDADWREAL